MSSFTTKDVTYETVLLFMFKHVKISTCQSTLTSTTNIALTYYACIKGDHGRCALSHKSIPYYGVLCHHCHMSRYPYYRNYYK